MHGMRVCVACGLSKRLGFAFTFLLFFLKILLFAIKGIGISFQRGQSFLFIVGWLDQEQKRRECKGGSSTFAALGLSSDFSKSAVACKSLL